MKENSTKVKEKVCPMCGTEFKTFKDTVKYCSDTCRVKADKETKRRYHKTHPTYMRDYMREYRAKKKAEATNQEDTKDSK